MTRPALTSSEERELATRLKNAFARYAMLTRGIAAPPFPQESIEDAVARITLYGEELSRAVLGEVQLVNGFDFPKFKRDAYTLLNLGFPELDLVELSLLCTSGLNFGSSLAFDVFGFSEQTLVQVRGDARRLSRQLSVLNHLPAVGLISSLNNMMMPRRERRVLRKKITQLPDLLAVVEELLNCQIGELAPGPTEAAMLEFSQLVYFRLLLEHFGLGNPTLSAILQVMRAIRHSVQPIPPSARRLDPVTLRNKDGSPHSSRARDPLSAGAIEKTMCATISRLAMTAIASVVRLFYRCCR
jgi:hypothetical protein